MKKKSEINFIKKKKIILQERPGVPYQQSPKTIKIVLNYNSMWVYFKGTS
jgi:hypothetical protein